VLEVARVTRDLLTGVRAGNGPALLETVTYRHRGHVGPKDDVDVGVQRSLADIEGWKRRDPISRLASLLSSSGRLTETALEALTARIRAEVAAASAKAQAAAYPPDDALLKLVYADQPTPGKP
jgi:pyruvate dehydrogenase E1 component alpha subunit